MLAVRSLAPCAVCLSVLCRILHGAQALQPLAEQVSMSGGRVAAADRRAVKRRPIQPILDMKLYQGNASAQVASCQALSQMTRVTREQTAKMLPRDMQLQIMREGGDVRTIKTMRMHPDHVELQIECMHALGMMALFSPKVYEAMGRHGALQVMADTITRFHDNIQVLKRVQDVSAFLDFHGAEAQQNLARLEKTSIMDTVLDGLDNYGHDGEVVASLLNFLSNACFSTSFKEKMLKRSFITKSITMMQEHANATDLFFNPLGVRGSVIAALSECFLDTEESRNHMVDSGLIPELVGTMVDATHGVIVDRLENPRMQKNAMTIIRTLMEQRPSLREEFVKTGVVNQIMFAINETLAKPRLGCSTVKLLVDKMPPPCPALMEAIDKYMHDMVEAHLHPNATGNATGNATSNATKGNHTLRRAAESRRSAAAHQNASHPSVAHHDTARRGVARRQRKSSS